MNNQELHNLVKLIEVETKTSHKNQKRRKFYSVVSVSLALFVIIFDILLYLFVYFGG